MRDYRSLLGFIILVTFSTPAAAADPGSEVPFKLFRNAFILVRGSVGNVDSVNLLIDTGAANTVINSALVKKLELDTSTCKAIGLLAEDREVQEVEVAELSFGPVKVTRLNALVLDLSRVDLGKRVDAVVGLDVLRNINFTIDYRAKRLRFDDRAPLASAATLSSLAPLLTVSLEVGEQTLNVMLDSGSDTQGAVLFEGRLKGELSRLRMLDRVSIQGAQGPQFACRVELRQVSLGDKSWKRLPATVLARKGPEELELDGLLSLRSLGARQIHFDFGARSVSWE